MTFTLTELNKHLDKFFSPQKCPFRIEAAIELIFDKVDWFLLEDPTFPNKQIFYKTTIGFVRLFFN